MILSAPLGAPALSSAAEATTFMAHDAGVTRPEDSAPGVPSQPTRPADKKAKR